MSWQLVGFIVYIVLVMIGLLYYTMMEYIAEAKHKEFTFRDLLGGPETLVHMLKINSLNK